MLLLLRSWKWVALGGQWVVAGCVVLGRDTSGATRRAKASEIFD